MLEKNLRILEFTKIREFLAEYAISDPGKDALRALTPESDPATVYRLQAETEEALTVISLTGGNPMAFFTDVTESMKLSVIGSTLSMKALLRVAETLRASRTVRASLVTDREDTPFLTELGSRLITNRALEEEILSALLSEDEMSDNASSELYSIRRHIRQINDRVRDRLNEMTRSSTMQKYLMDSLVTMRNGRYVLPVRAESRQFVPGIVHDQSGSGSTLFIEPMAVVEAGNELKQWTVKEHQEMERILADFSARIAPDAEMIIGNIHLLSRIDAIFAKACYARQTAAVPPKLNADGRINILRGRHPLLDPQTVVPLDLHMGDDYTTLIITGPNTGGKTVTLKTVGLFTLMAQAGMQIPAAYGTELAIFDDVYADIGDEQSIEQSLSTFSSHMTHIVQILDNATERSMVLFDELGAGTDPTEGAALAMSILTHLLTQKIITLATTHYSELKAFALSTKGVENASVEFDVESLRPTYRLSIGVPGKSNAFEISRKLGLPEALIRDAGERLTKDQIRFEDVIANAEYHRQIAEKERKLAEEAHIETTRIRNEADHLRKELESQRETMMKKAREDARKVLIKAQRESESLIAELKHARASMPIKEHELGEMRTRLQSSIDATAETIAARPEERTEAPKSLKAGDTVLLIQLGTKATVLSDCDGKGEVAVQAGAMKMKVRLADTRLTAADKPDKKHRAVGGGHTAIAPRAAAMECDVRGMTVEEAITQVDLFLDGAMLNSLKTVSIIHGKGTGALRAGIQEHLRRYPTVKEFRLGRYGEGEDGVTIVTLK